MAFEIMFSAPKTLGKDSINDNIHNDEYWGFAWELAEKSTPINQWPHQFTTHYIYELLNRPWLPEEDCLNDMTRWLMYYAPDLELKI